MADSLKVIFRQIINKAITKDTPLIGSDRIMRWVPILLCWVPDKHIGISEGGLWVVEENSGLRILSNAQSLIRIKILLEQPMAEVRKKLMVYFNSFDNVRVEDIDAIFPFVEIIKVVLEDGLEYWMELAFKWFDELPAKKKALLNTTLIQIVEDKSVTQKLRHKARKELKRINAETHRIDLT